MKGRAVIVTVINAERGIGGPGSNPVLLSFAQIFDNSLISLFSPPGYGLNNEVGVSSSLD